MNTRTDTPSPENRGTIPWLWIISFVLILALVVVTGAAAGFLSGNSVRQEVQVDQSYLTLQEQFNLGVQDFESGRYEVAYQRFEFVIAKDPGYPGVTEKMAQVMEILYTTATPVAPLSAPTLTPTRDLRPVEDLFDSAVTLVKNGDWTGGIDTLIALRKEDLTYQVARVDGLLYISFRNRGVEKILNQANLGGGIYDLAIAERFGPLDIEANTSRDWARLYMIGLSFWEVHPEQAVYYFGQVAAAAPYLRDASGWTATDRYRGALIQYGDLLAKNGDWCGAQAQYEIALSIHPDEAIQAAFDNAVRECEGHTPTPSPGTGTITPTVSRTTTITPPFTTNTPTATQGIIPSASATQTPTPSPTSTIPVVIPSETPTPSVTPAPSLTPTETLAPDPQPNETPQVGSISLQLFSTQFIEFTELLQTALSFLQ
jgi:tetratricopeptide (TPR) repeat protein